MKLLHAADLHFGDTTYGMDRLAEEYALVNELAESAAQHKVDAVLLAGDVWDTRMPGPREILVFGELVKMLRKKGITVIVGSGNHDGTPQIGEWETKTAGWMRALSPEGVHAFPAPHVGYLFVGPDNLPLQLYSLPYAHKRSFPIEAGTTAADRLEQASRAMERIIEELPPIEADSPAVFMGHMSVLGTFLKADSALKMGWDLAVRPELFERFTYAALGHIHRQQKILNNVWYSGRPTQSRFEEEGREAGWLIVEMSDNGVLTSITPVVSQVVQYMTVREDQWTDPDFRFAPFDRRTHLRLVYPHDCPENRKQSLHRQAVAAGAASIQTVTESKPKTDRTRAQIHADVTPVQGLSRWLEVTGKPQEPYLSVGRAMMEGETWNDSSTRVQESSSDPSDSLAAVGAVSASEAPASG
jgi:exonuclease SbcD